MQSRTTRVVRNLLVSIGAISLVLSVAAPSALADEPVTGQGRGGGPHADHVGTGTTRVLVCHDGRVLEIDDDALDAHVDHGDPGLGMADAVDAPERGADCTLPDGGVDGDDLVFVCRDGQVAEIAAADLGPGELPESVVDGGQVSCGDDLDTDDDLDDDIDDDLDLDIDDDLDLDIDDDLDIDGDEGLDEDAGEQLDGTGTTPVRDRPGRSAGAPVASPPAQPLPPEAATRPVVVISADAVTKRAAPVTPAISATSAGPQRGTEVLGAVTTRTPTAGSVTTLAATGSTTTFLTVIGSALLLAGFGLQLGARRVRSSDLAT